MSDSREAFIQRVQEMFVDGVPHNAALGMKIVGLDDGKATIDLPYRPEIVGNPETGVIHGGAVTALLDSACGAAVLGALRGPRRVATLDLRIDYLGPATPERTVRCEAHCYKVTKNVAFVRASAFHEDTPRVDIAAAAGTFVVFEQAAPRIVPEALADPPPGGAPGRDASESDPKEGG